VRNRSITFVVVMLLVWLVPVQALAAPPESKRVVCHVTGNGTWIAIEVAAGAVPAHLGHGDGLANEVPAVGYGACEDSNGDGVLDVNEANICVHIDGVEVIRNGTADCFSTASTGTDANIAVAHGVSSHAEATIGNNNMAIATGERAWAIAGHIYDDHPGGDNNTADATGVNSSAFAGAGNDNIAVVTGDRAFAQAHIGNSNTASAFGLEFPP